MSVQIDTHPILELNSDYDNNEYQEKKKKKKILDMNAISCTNDDKKLFREFSIEITQDRSHSIFIFELHSQKETEKKPNQFKIPYN